MALNDSRKFIIILMRAICAYGVGARTMYIWYGHRHSHTVKFRFVDFMSDREMDHCEWTCICYWFHVIFFYICRRYFHFTIASAGMDPASSTERRRRGDCDKDKIFGNNICLLSHLIAERDDRSRNDCMIKILQKKTRKKRAKKKNKTSNNKTKLWQINWT